MQYRCCPECLFDWDQCICVQCDECGMMVDVDGDCLMCEGFCDDECWDDDPGEWIEWHDFDPDC